MELHHLFVKDGHRSEGIGRHLIDRAKAHAYAFPATSSRWARHGNFAAYKYYQGLDFKAYPQPACASARASDTLMKGLQAGSLPGPQAQ